MNRRNEDAVTAYFAVMSAEEREWLDTSMDEITTEG